MISPLQLTLSRTSGVHPAQTSFYLSTSRSAGIDFHSHGGGSFGRPVITEAAINIHRVGEALGLCSNQLILHGPLSIFGYLGITLWRGNVCVWLHRVSMHSSSQTDSLSDYTIGN